MNKLFISSAIAISLMGTNLFAAQTPVLENSGTTSGPAINYSIINQKLQDSLATMVDKTVSATGEATTFLVNQIPDVLQQLLRWKMMESLLSVIFPIILFLIAACGYGYWLKKVIQWGCFNTYDPVGYVLGALFGGAAVFGLFLSACFHFDLVWLQIWIAPKVYLLEYAKSLVTK